MDHMLIIFFSSLLLLGSGAFFKWLENVFLTGPLIALATGTLLGPEVLAIIDLPGEKQDQIMISACEFTIAMALMATALRLSRKFIWKNLRSQLWVLLSGMLFMSTLSTIILYWITGYLSFSESLLIGAVITPTDPVIASTLITGERAKKYMPSLLRKTISFESGSNDGLAYPLVFMSVLIYNEGIENFPISSFLLNDIFYATILCAIGGYITGLLTGRLMHFANNKGIMNKKSVLPFSMALAFLLLSGFNLLAMNGILAVFAGSLGFIKHLNKNEDLKEERIQESMERIFTIPVFFLLGIFLPWQEWYEMGWTAVFIVLGILLFRRLPGILLLYPVLKKYGFKFRDCVILGWFGPIGAAALFYALEVKEKTGYSDVWIFTVLVVAGSTLIHGLTSLPFERIYGQQEKKQK